MKKWVRRILIAGIAFCFVGAGVMTAGAVMGGGHSAKRLLDWGHGWGHYWEDSVRIPQEDLVLPEIPFLEDPDMEAREDRVLPEIPSPEYPDMEAREEWSLARSFPGSGELALEEGSFYEGVRQLDLELAGNRVELREWEALEEGQIWIFCFGDREQRYRITQKGERLAADFPDLRGVRGPAESMVIYVPVAWVFQEVEIENAGGNFQAERIYGEKLSLETMGGKTHILGGSIRILDLECQAGKSICQAVVSGKTSVECDAGEVSLVLAGEEELYDYSLECNAGSIAIIGKEVRRYRGLNVETKLDNGTGRRVDLECDAGAITVVFQEPVV